jgi:hypothetical protein
VKSSVLLKWGLFLSIALFCLGIRSGDISASQEKPAISKLPPVEKKQPAEASNEKLPEIFLESTEHDGGAVYEGSVITHSFIVKNKGEGDLLIKKVRPG